MKAETFATFQLKPCRYLLVQSQQLETQKQGVRHFQS